MRSQGRKSSPNPLGSSIFQLIPWELGSGGEVSFKSVTLRLKDVVYGQFSLTFSSDPENPYGFGEIW